MYGIKNCDTIKKARRWLEENNISYIFHDYKKSGIDETLLKAWCTSLGWENILNKRGTTWRKLPEESKNTINESNAIKIMALNTSIIKRPILEIDEKKIVGFDKTEYQTLL